VVAVVSPLTPRLTLVLLEPVTGLPVALVLVVPLDKSETVPYLKVTLELAPLALTVPFRVPAVLVMLLAALVVAVGAARVVKLRIVPLVLPTLFTARTWK